MGEIAYPNFELDDVAKSFLPLNRLDAGKGRNPFQRGRFLILLLIILCFVMHVVDEGFHCSIVGDISSFRSVSFSFR